MAYDRREHAIKDPTSFVKRFGSLEDFRINWCRRVILIQLVHSLLTFEEDELYEHCEVIQQEIDRYTDRLVDGFLGKT